MAGDSGDKPTPAPPFDFEAEGPPTCLSPALGERADPEPNPEITLENSEASEACPWEHQAELGWFANWWKSFTALATSPVAFLAHAHPTDRLGRAIGFGLTTALFAHLLAGPKRYLLFAKDEPARERFVEMMSQFDWGEALQPLFTRLPGFWETEWAGLLGLPVGWCAGLFAAALLLHAPIRLFGGRGGLSATIKALCFSSPALALAMLPWVGGALAWAVQCALCAAGIQIFHRLSTPRLAMAFLFWPIFGVFYVRSIFALIWAAANQSML